MRRWIALGLLAAAGNCTAQIAFWPHAAAATRWTEPSSSSSEPAEIRTADDLLLALERADRGLVSLTADVRYDRFFELQGDRQERRGRLEFLNAAAEGQRRQFAIRFTKLIVGDVLREEPQTFAFDGEWLVEINPAQKKMTRWQVVAPGEAFDPLRLGSGPLPIPIGQRRDDIVSRFDAVLASSGDGLEAGDMLTAAEAAALRGFVEGSTQIVLTPRAGGPESEDFREVRLWYSRGAGGRLLPRMARTINQAGDISLVMLTNVATQDVGGPINPEAAVDPALFRVNAPDDGWLVEVRPFRRTGVE